MSFINTENFSIKRISDIFKHGGPCAEVSFIYKDRNRQQIIHIFTTYQVSYIAPITSDRVQLPMCFSSMYNYNAYKISHYFFINFHHFINGRFSWIDPCACGIVAAFGHCLEVGQADTHFTEPFP